MSHPFEAIKVTDSVYWVGAIDWTVRNFHGYRTSRGTTYNAYLIVGDELTLIDAVRMPFQQEMLARIASVADPRQIRHIVSNHAELDHTQSLPEVLQLAQPQTLIASEQGAKALQDHFHWDQQIKVVKHGQQLSLGNTNLRFVEAKMLHWPDSMFTYLEGPGVLFSNDAFGMHLASSERFIDELPPDDWQREAAKYFANILMPFSARVSKLLKELPKFELDLRIIAPDHGPIWREQPTDIIDRYASWAAREPQNKAVVAYDTMWHSTAQMARAIADGLAHGGLNVRLMPLQASHHSDVASELLDAGALLVGSSTLNNQMLPAVAGLLTYLKGLRPKNLLGAAFGSYGWGGQAVGLVEQALGEMNVKIVEEGLRIRYVPDADGLTQCRTLGTRVAAKLRETQDG